MAGEYRPRLVIELTEEQFFRKQRLLNLSHGMQKAVFSAILDDLLDMVETHGAVVLGVILNRQLKPRSVIPILSEASNAGESE